MLSRDQDMMRYGLARGRVLSDFAIRNGKISFLTRDNQTKAARRDISSIECDDLSKWESQGSTLRIHAMQKEIRRGNPDGRTRTATCTQSCARFARRCTRASAPG